MSYSAGIFHLDYEGGSDAARTALTGVVASNPSGTITRMTFTGHGLATGAIVDATLFTAWLNDAWKITVFDANNFDLVGAVWQATADANGTVTPRGGASNTDAWKTWTAGATAARIQPGDTIRQKGSPNPTSLAQLGTWSDGPLASTIVPTSSTNATPIVMVKAGHPFVTGDTVIVNGHTGNTNANGVWEASVVGDNVTLLNADGSNSVGNGIGGATGTMRKANNLRVMLATAVTKNVAVTGNQGASANWTAAVNVTTSVITTDNKEGGECQSIAVAAGFVTGIAAHFPTGTLDLSLFQQLSFKIKQTVGTVGAASSISLRLCSDTAGATTLHTFNIPALVALGQWVGFTIDNAAALSAVVASIAFDVNTDNGAQTFLLDNIIAVKAASAADSLSLTSLIGKNTVDETWCAIQSINSKRVMLDGMVNHRPTTGNSVLQRGYSGTTESVTAFKRETIKHPIAALLATTTPDFNVQDSGSVAAGDITFSGGWNRTDMLTQDGETWLDGQNGFGSGGPFAQGRAYLTFDKISAVRFGVGVQFTTSHDISLLGYHGNNNTSRGFASNQNSRINFDVKSLSYNGLDGGLGGQIDGMTGTIGLVDGNGTITQGGLSLNGKGGDLTVKKARNTNGYGVQFVPGASGDLLVRGLMTSGNAISGVAQTGGNQTANSPGRIFLLDAQIAEATEVTSSAFAGGLLWSKNHDGVAGYNVGFTDGALIYTTTTVRHTASGVAWAVSISNPTNRTSDYPVRFELLRVAVAANAAVTFKAWLRKTDPALVHRLFCEGGQIAGVPTDVVSASPAVADTWEELTITFTPTASGVVVLGTETFGAVDVGYVDDLTCTQA